MIAFALTPTRYLQAIEKESGTLADAASGALELPVPSCPGWEVADLVGHVGLLHRRVAAMVTRPVPERVDTADLPPPPEDGARLKWFREGAVALVAALGASGTERPCWTLDDPAGKSGFWFRRMAQETLLHRVDAELATTGVTPINGSLAADGIDELFRTHLPRRLARRPIAGLAATLLVDASDVDARWTLELTPEALVLDDTLAAPTSLRGPAADLLCFFWNRGGPARLSMDGEIAVLEKWSELVQM